MKNAWDFVEKYYPNYPSCGEIAENNDLQKIIDGEWEEGDCAHKLYKEIADIIDVAEEDEIDIVQEAKLRLAFSNERIYQKAIEGFISNSDNKISIGWNVEDVLSKADEMEIEITEAQAKEVLSLVESKHDATVGINWDVIGEWICYVYDRHHFKN